MNSLNRTSLAEGKLAVESSGPSSLKPTRILQIGDGNFLRAFVDWMVDVANGAGLMNGEVIMAQPLERGVAELMKAQDQLFTVLLRGVQNGRPVQSKRLVSCVRDTLNPYAQWNAMLAAMRDPALRFVVSNTTEAGIAYVGGTARSESVALAPDSSAVRVSPSRAAGAAPIDLDLAGPVIASVASVAPEDTYEPPAGTVLVPEVKRMRVADARVLLESYGLRVSVRDTSGESVGRSEERFFRVRTQSPRLNERVPEGAVVQLRARPVGGYGQGY